MRKIVTTAALLGTLFAAEACNRSPPPTPPSGIDTIQLQSQNPYGETPYERNLRVEKYSIDRLKDIHTLATGDVIATLYVTFSRGNVSETYEIEVTNESSRDAQILANNLSRYNIITIPTGSSDNGKGDRTDGVRAVQTERGIVYRMPASSLKFSDFENYTVTTKQPPKDGTIDNSRVHRPWLPGGQRDEKPCIPDEAHRSVCGPQTQTPPAAKPKPAPAPAKPVPKPTEKKSQAASNCDECYLLGRIFKYVSDTFANTEKLRGEVREVRDHVDRKEYPKD